MNKPACCLRRSERGMNTRNNEHVLLPLLPATVRPFVPAAGAAGPGPGARSRYLLRPDPALAACCAGAADGRSARERSRGDGQIILSGNAAMPLRLTQDFCS